MARSLVLSEGLRRNLFLRVVVLVPVLRRRKNAYFLVFSLSLAYSFASIPASPLLLTAASPSHLQAICELTIITFTKTRNYLFRRASTARCLTGVAQSRVVSLPDPSLNSFWG